MKIKAPAGMEDLLPGRLAHWRKVEDKVRRVMATYGYGEIRTPMLEATSLFVRSVGEATDIVEKEMYTFGHANAPEDSVTLRPELTAPIVRACLEHSLFAKRPFHKLFYLGAAFRRERPQKGRLRQFHQFGVEALGSHSPVLDAETIELAVAVLEALGLREHTVRLNSTGCATCRNSFRVVLRERLTPDLERVCEDCRSRFERNVFRVLDCKRDSCRPVIQRLPSIQEHLCADCRGHHAVVTATLGEHGIPFTPDPLLVRGLDYYTRTVYELTYPTLGAQNAIGGGGRYDNLVAEFGGPPTGAVGFAMGIERVMLALDAQAGGRDANEDHITPVAVYLCTVEDALRAPAFAFARRVRQAGIPCDLDFEGKSLKAQMRNADRLRARWVVMFGPEEWSRGAAKLKSMQEKSEETLPLDAIVARIQAADTGSTARTP